MDIPSVLAMSRRIRQNLGSRCVACIGASGRVYCEPSSSIRVIAGDPIIHYVDNDKLWTDWHFGSVSRSEYNRRIRAHAEEAVEILRQRQWEREALARA